MKTKYIITVIFIGCFTLLQAQDAIDKYFSKYADDPEFTSIVISSKMFQLFAKMNVDGTDNKDVKDAISGLKGIRILSYEQGEGAPKNTDYKELVKKVGSDYEVLMSVDDKDEKVRFFIREDGEMIKELFMIVGGKGNLFLMSLVGNIDLEKMSSLSKNMNIGGMNYLDNLNDKQKNK